MDGKLGLGRFWRWAQGQRQTAAPDAADVGTAFGMELSIEAERREARHPPQAVAEPAERAPAAVRRPR